MYWILKGYLMKPLLLVTMLLVVAGCQSTYVELNPLPVRPPTELIAGLSLHKRDVVKEDDNLVLRVVFVADHEYTVEDVRRVQALLNKSRFDGYVASIIYDKPGLIVLMTGIRYVRWKVKNQSMFEIKMPLEPKPVPKPVVPQSGIKGTCAQ